MVENTEYNVRGNVDAGTREVVEKSLLSFNRSLWFRLPFDQLLLQAINHDWISEPIGSGQTPETAQILANEGFVHPGLHVPWIRIPPARSLLKHADLFVDCLVQIIVRSPRLCTQGEYQGPKFAFDRVFVNDLLQQAPASLMHEGSDGLGMSASLSVAFCEP